MYPRNIKSWGKDTIWSDHPGHLLWIWVCLMMDWENRDMVGHPCEQYNEHGVPVENDFCQWNSMDVLNVMEKSLRKQKWDGLVLMSDTRRNSTSAVKYIVLYNIRCSYLYVFTLEKVTWCTHFAFPCYAGLIYYCWPWQVVKAICLNNFCQWYLLHGSLLTSI